MNFDTDDLSDESYADIDDIFFGNPPKKNDFREALKRILNNISKLHRSS